MCHDSCTSLNRFCNSLFSLSGFNHFEHIHEYSNPPRRIVSEKPCKCLSKISHCVRYSDGREGSLVGEEKLSQTDSVNNVLFSSAPKPYRNYRCS